jgi:hypothetical protein
MNEIHRGYVSYLLRLWQAQNNGEWIWQASLENPQSGQRRAFANLDDALAFIRLQTVGLSTDQKA